MIPCAGISFFLAIFCIKKSEDAHRQFRLLTS